MNAMNKLISKKLFIKNKIKTPAYEVIRRKNYIFSKLKKIIKIKNLIFQL